MFLHLGGDVVTPKKDVIAILDVCCLFSPVTVEFVEITKEKKNIYIIAEKGKEKSYVITNRKVFVSPISCSTLKKRAESFLSNED